MAKTVESIRCNGQMVSSHFSCVFFCHHLQTPQYLVAWWRTDTHWMCLNGFVPSLLFKKKTKCRSLAPVHKHTQSLCKENWTNNDFSWRYVNCMIKIRMHHHRNNRLDPRAVHAGIFLKDLETVNSQPRIWLFDRLSLTTLHKREIYSHFSKYASNRPALVYTAFNKRRWIPSDNTFYYTYWTLISVTMINIQPNSLQLCF